MPFRFFLLLPLVFSAHLRAQAQRTGDALIIHGRIGTEIDARERAYFGLFPRHDHFNLARLYADSDSTAVFVVQSGEVEDVVVVSLLTLDTLRDYLGQFEDVHRQWRRIDWGLIRTLIRPVQRPRAGAHLTVTMHGGRAESGRLLYVDDDILVLTRRGRHPHRLTDTRAAVPIRPYAIRHVTGGGWSPTALLNEIVIPEAGNADRFQASTLPLLRRYSAFRGPPAPEIETLIDSFPAGDIPEAYSTDDTQHFVHSLARRLHFAIDYSYPIYSSYGQYELQLRTSATVEENVRLPAAHARFNAYYSPSERIWLGVGMQTDFAPTPPPLPAADPIKMSGQPAYLQAVANDRGYVILRNLTLTALASYVIKPFDPLVRLPGIPLSTTAGYEIRVEGGPGIGFFASETGLAAIEGAADVVIQRFHRRNSAYGATAAIAMDFYLTRNISLGAGFEARYFPHVRIEEANVEVPSGRVRKMMLGTSYPLLLTSISFGLRYHKG